MTARFGNSVMEVGVIDAQERLVRWAVARWEASRYLDEGETSDGMWEAGHGVNLDDADFGRSDVTFEMDDAGACPTCSHEYVGAFASVAFGRRRITFEVPFDDEISLSRILSEMAEL